jgi:hypothetical protein
MTTHSDAVRESFANDPNASWDEGIGFCAAGICDAIEERFGVMPSFGVAGGCVNMCLTLETGHVLHIHDYDEPLTHAKVRTAADGFSVAVYLNDEASGWGADELVFLRRHVDADGLGDLIAAAIAELAFVKVEDRHTAEYQQDSRHFGTTESGRR